MSDDTLSKFPVTEAAQRPAGRAGACFYCDEPVGGLHKNRCGLVVRYATVSATITYQIPVPAFATEYDIEAARNVGSWCADNIADEIEHLVATEYDEKCMCNCVKYVCVEREEERFVDEEGTAAPRQVPTNGEDG